MELPFPEEALECSAFLLWFSTLLTLYSWRGALLILGGLVSNLCVCGSLMRPLVDQHKGEEENVNQTLDELCVREDSIQVEVKDTEEEPEEYSEELILTDTEMMGKLKDTKQDANSEPTNLKDLSTESILKDSNLVTQLAELQVADLKLHDSKLITSMLPDMKQTDSKLCDAMLNDVNLAKLTLADPKLVTPKLPESQLLCESVSSNGPGLPIKQSRKRGKPKCCLFQPSSDKYSFLFLHEFLLLAVSFLFLAFGCNVPLVYIVPYSLSLEISHHQAVLLMSILRAMGIVGNITFGWISDRNLVIVSAVYIPPQADTDTALGELHEALTLHQTQHRDAAFIVAGDFNSANLKRAVPNFHQHITFPTRGGRTLDHCYTQFKDCYKAQSHPPFGKSDHAAIFLMPGYKQRLKQEDPVQQEVAHGMDQSVAVLQDALDDGDWDMFRRSSDDVNVFTKAPTTQ
ncbi:hypothetical protein QTP70_032716 [Hemibagrus guttatus]|uniref:Endonuclease/exonuclease/phosphatase domain-containing protein n=1 Tax=Hemibagrus guttatus TaxID=175788 RepID=A0AAE0V6K9_9TELE|nr:hypothetical protein QTP70_032716 [Hemibagrus guttatus]